MHIHGFRYLGVIEPEGKTDHSSAVTEQTPPPAEPDAAAMAPFLAELSHELRTPLAAIIGFADAMRGRAFGPLSETYAKHAALIGQAGRHMLDLVGDLADLSRIDEDPAIIAREPFDAGPLIADAARLMAGQADAAAVNLDIRAPTRPLMVAANRRRLRQIVLNLVSNAVKFTPARGSVIVTAGTEGDALVLEVIDTGVGIAPRDLARLARPLPGRAASGGLGLDLARACCEAHGGTLTIESALGAGTRVTVRLPALGQAR